MTQCVLGVDVGGTSTKFIAATREGEILASGSIPTDANEPAEKFFERLAGEASKLLSERNLSPIAVGVGAPNGNRFRGTIEHPPNLVWGEVDVVGEVRKYFPVPVAADNDANAAAIAEGRHGAARGHSHFVTLTLGTGVGGGVVADGKIVRGSDGFAGELGHLIAVPGGRECGCGARGCLETYASARGFKRTIFELLAERLDKTPLRDVSFNDLSGREIDKLAGQGDPIATRAFFRTGEVLGRALANVVAVTQPAIVVLAGGLARAGDLLLQPARDALEMNLLNVYKGKTELVVSEFTDGEGGALGAADLAWEELDGGAPRGI